MSFERILPQSQPEITPVPEEQIPENFYNYDVQHSGQLGPEQLRNILLGGMPIYFGIDMENKKIIYSFDQPEGKKLITASFRLKKIESAKLEGYVAEINDDLVGPVEIIKNMTSNDPFLTAIDKIQDALGIKNQGKIEKPDWGIKTAIDHSKKN